MQRFDITTDALWNKERVGVARIVDDADHTVLWLAFHRGQILKEHRVPRIALIQVLRGALDLAVEGTVSRLTPGQLVELAPGTVHALTAVEDSVLQVVQVGGGAAAAIGD